MLIVFSIGLNIYFEKALLLLRCSINITWIYSNNLFYLQMHVCMYVHAYMHMYVCVYVVGIYNRLTGMCNVHGARAEVAACGRALKNFFFASQRMQDEAQVQLRGRAKTRADMLLRHGTVIKLALMLSLGLWTASVALSFSYLVLCLPPTLSVSLSLPLSS